MIGMVRIGNTPKNLKKHVSLRVVNPIDNREEEHGKPMKEILAEKIFLIFLNRCLEDQAADAEAARKARRLIGFMVGAVLRDH